jgi:hypothetical protein
MACVSNQYTTWVITVHAAALCLTQVSNLLTQLPILLFQVLHALFLLEHFLHDQIKGILIHSLLSPLTETLARNNG